MNTIHQNLRGRIAGRAFTLIEVTLALGVAGFCLVTVFGLLPVGLTSNQASLNQTAAGNIASAIVSDLRSAQQGGTSSPHFGIPIPTPAGTASGTAQSSGTTIYLSGGGAPSANGVASPGGGAGAGASIYRATIAFSFPPSGQYSAPVSSRTATYVRILITWPALADPAPGVWSLGSSPSWPTHYSGSYEADTTLDRN